MNYGTLLFDPNGRLAPRPFLIGMAILLVVQILLSVLSAFVSVFIGSFGLVFYWCYFALYGKRLHDAGLTAWLVLLVLIAYIVVSVVISPLIMAMLAPEVKQMQVQMTEDLSSGAITIFDMFRIIQDITRIAIPATIVQYLLLTLIMGGGMALLPSQKTANKHGPASGDVAEAEEF